MSARMACRDPVTVHEPSYSLRGLAGEQFDVAESDPAAPVEIFYELPRERDWPREALPDWAARRHVGKLMPGKHSVNEVISARSVVPQQATFAVPGACFALAIAPAVLVAAAAR